jgi:hypothetical protein
MTQFDLFTASRHETQPMEIALALRDAGVERTLRVERESWIETALGFLRRFAHTRGEFTVEQIREAMGDAGIHPPHTHHVWGALTRKAIAAGLIEFVRYEKATSPATHGHPVAVWRRAGAHRDA